MGNGVYVPCSGYYDLARLNNGLWHESLSHQRPHRNSKERKDRFELREALWNFTGRDWSVFELPKPTQIACSMRRRCGNDCSLDGCSSIAYATPVLRIKSRTKAWRASVVSTRNLKYVCCKPIQSANLTGPEPKALPAHQLILTTKKFPTTKRRTCNVDKAKSAFKLPFK